MKLRDVAWSILAIAAGIATYVLVSDFVIAQQTIRSTGLAVTEGFSAAYAKAQGIVAGSIVAILSLYATALNIGERSARRSQRLRAGRK